MNTRRYNTVRVGLETLAPAADAKMEPCSTCGSPALNIDSYLTEETKRWAALSLSGKGLLEIPAW